MTTPNKDPELARQIETMSAFASGKTIEGQARHGDPTAWRVCICPTWNWDANDYRVQPEPRSVWFLASKGILVRYFSSEVAAQVYVDQFPFCTIVEFKEVLK